ncbi:hypothetical protein CK489_25025 [Bradyrhizobium sp. UFLA03-84]|nr:hypothetical protein CK489_25025 [Bradyrhizobium sp. UFLA03-84]
MQGNIYEDYACNSVTGQLSKSLMAEIQNIVRARVLELTIQIEKNLPTASDIVLGPPKAEPGEKEKKAVTQITNQIVHGNYTSISNTGQGAQFNLHINSNDAASVAKELEAAGITPDDAQAISKIFASEAPESREEPFGRNAKSWIAKNLSKAVDGTWKVGVSVATQILSEAALRYYGFK